MRFGPVPLSEAAGAILAHSHRLEGDRMLRKGIVLTQEHVAALARAGHEDVVAARLDPDDVGENEAAALLARAATGAHLTLGSAHTGRVNVFANAHGVLVVDPDQVDVTNAVDEGITLATLPRWSVVQAGEMVATIKIIPYAVCHGALTLATAACKASPALRLAPLPHSRAGLVVSTMPGMSPKLLKRAESAQRTRLTALGCSLERVDLVPHGAAAVADALRTQLDQGLDPILFLGASAIIDRRDVLPMAIEAIGGEVVHFGMPVDPGNLLLLGRRGAQTLIGMPGCARSTKPSGFDWVLARVLAGLAPVSKDLHTLGVGGLLKDIAARPAPRRRPPVTPPAVASVVLAAGRSSRMGAENKLLVPLDGEPLVSRAVDAALDSRASPVIVVTGHMADEIKAALGNRPVVYAHNPNHEEGMSTSIRAGLAQVPETAQGVMISLGDMPFVTPQTIDQLLEAFDPEGGAAICRPVHERRHGHPVVWARRFFPALGALSGDQGARSVIAAHFDDVHLVEVDHPGIHLDVDTPEALAAARLR